MSVVLSAQGLVKHFGKVVALDGSDFELRSGEILAVIGDNGAGKTSLIKVLCGAMVPDKGVIELDGKKIHFRSSLEARIAGIETVYQDLALAPAMSITDNIFLGREIREKSWWRFLGKLDRKEMRRIARHHLNKLGLLTIQNINQPVESLSGGQRQAIAVARSAIFSSKVVIMDEPTAALGVKEARKVLDLIAEVKNHGLSIVLISHNMPQVFELADRVHIQRLGKRIAVVDPKEHSMSDVVAIMTGAVDPPSSTATG